MTDLEQTIERTRSFVETVDKDDRKTYGQFFTAQKSAEFMSAMFNVDIDKPVLKILDAGAGSGILSVALVENLRNRGYHGEIILVCYETDDKVLGLLKNNLESIKDINFSFDIRQENYITSQPFLGFGVQSLFAGKGENDYDLVIGNPPYKKISKSSEEAKHMKDICYGAPNLYFLFWAMAIQNLSNGGELVYIIPRSWTSGAYFAKFRKYLFANCVITNIHLFGSRDKVFDGESVLQETMIIKVKKTHNCPGTVMITFSDTSDFTDVKSMEVPYNTIVGKDGYVYLVTTRDELNVLSVLNKFPNTLVSDGLRMKTGIVVDFRTKQVLRSEEENGTYPLIYSQHIRDGRIQWPMGKDGEYIKTERQGLLQENSDYLFVKRFTAKEEKRRLQCGIYLSSDLPNYKYISTQNKINYIKCENSEEVYGLYVLLNSTIYDKYYRILNGSTQVNSTEINQMPVPSKETICKMGREIMHKDLSENSCNEILSKWIR